jgi:transaldolase
MAKTPLQELADHGQSVWSDYLSRKFVRDGDLAALVDRGVVGVTSNPTIFQAAIADGDAYDDQIREIVAGGESEPKEIFLALAADDIRGACDVLLDTFESTDHVDGYVSLEVDPNLAHDTDGTIAEAKRLSELVSKDNLLVKIPATKEGLPAIEETIAAGIAVNVTLIFSLDRHREVAEA